MKTNGLIDLEELKKAIRLGDMFASVMAVNNEMLQLLKEIGEICRANKVFFTLMLHKRLKDSECG